MRQQGGGGSEAGALVEATEALAINQDNPGDEVYAIIGKSLCE